MRRSTSRSSIRASEASAAAALIAALAGCAAPERAPAVVEVPPPAAPSASAEAAPSAPTFTAEEGLKLGPTGCSAPSGTLICSTFNETLVLEGDRLTERQLSGEEEKAPGGWELVTSYGIGPHRDPFLLTLLRVNELTDKQGRGFVYRLVSRVWEREADLGDHWVPMALEAWSKDRWLALATHDLEPRFRFVSKGGAAADLPQPSAAAFAKDATALAPTAFTALPSGEVVLVGRLRTQDDVAFSHDGARDAAQPPRGAWERWAPSATKGELAELAWNGDGLVPCCVKVRSPQEIWIAGRTAGDRGFVGAWDGKAWRFEAAPAAVRTFDVEPDGTAWVGTKAGLLRRRVGEAFREVPLPRRKASSEPPVPTFVWARGPGDVWVASEQGSDRWLYRTLPLPPIEKLAVSPEEHRAREHAGDTGQMADSLPRDKDPTYFPQKSLAGCATPFVHIGTVPAGAPASFDHAAVAKALRGKKALEAARFIEFARGGRRQLGARVPDAATGRKLVAALSGLSPRPALVCFETSATRSLVFDFATGTLSRSGAP